MKYLIVRKHREDPFTELVAAGEGGGEPALPFTVETHDLGLRDVADLRRDPTVEDLVASMPFTLIAPVEQQTAATPVPIAWGLDDVGAANSPLDGAGATVAILDTGIDTAHPAFAGLSFAPNDLMDFTTDELGAAGTAPDSDGHGTHVAGTIFGRDVNGTRIGVARGIKKVLIGKVLGPHAGPTEAVFNAIEWALRRRADIISMSLGMDFPRLVRSLIKIDLPEDIAAARALEAYRSNVSLFDRLADLVEARVSRGRGALLVAAAGNQSRRNENARFTVPVAPPAAADGFVSVGAVAPTGAVAHFSNTGCLLAAPGVSILSAQLGGGLKSMHGTSMAAPHVAGVAALWTQKLFPDGSRPNGWAKDVLAAIQSHLRPVPGQARDDIGGGVVQAPQ
jgi:subtilisin family serine protease